MAELKYQPIARRSRKAILEALDSGDPEQIHNALDSAAYWDKDWRWAQAQLLRFADDDREVVLSAVVLGFTFLAVFHGELDETVVMPALKRLKQRPGFQGRVEDVEADIKHFVIRRRKGAKVELARRLPPA